MKTSIRKEFALGLVIFFLIIVALSILSTVQLSRLSKKTSEILKENHFSVVYAREMSEALTNINQEITRCFIINKYPDSAFIYKAFSLFDKSLHLEKNNITEVGEDKLVYAIESDYNVYRDSTVTFIKIPESVNKIIFLQKKFTDLHQQLTLLSQMNVNAIELKTNNAKVSAKNALLQVISLGTLCFLIALIVTYSFASYFNERLFQLHNGIKEIVSSNFGQRLHFDGKDEFNEIALVFNEMAEKLSEKRQNIPLSVKEDSENDTIMQDVEELRKMLARIKVIEEEASGILSKFKTPKG
jgi:two-component system, NtrC family, sensor histidine kinase KinB